MSVWNHLGELGGLTVHPFLAYEDIETFETDNDEHLARLVASMPEPGSVAWKIATHFDAELEFADIFGMFLETVDTTQVRALVLGYWATDILDDENGVVGVLCEHADRFRALRHLFVGDITGEEHEVSWITPEDITPLLDVFPHLEELGYRFGQGSQPVLRPTRHERLRRLVLQTGGMPAHVARAVAASDLPALDHLDLWLGVKMYGGDATTADLADLLDGTRHPALRHLGLMNSEIQDEIAAAVAVAPVVAQLRSLDLSMGVLSDTGAEALLAGRSLTHLERLTVHHHFLGDGAARRLREALEPAGVTVDLSEPCTPWGGAATPEEGRYTQVAE
ncbi:STM4015 family protein [Embleya sp. NBC_00896]|uniref:STM4015 family protein n=1 Tax=Embleya sp. NBC_00896 TaxID=2975961 RepID=UPI002F91AE3B|nr:STM4015 family protein [Embleya sp. NBC_00896]